MSGTFVGMPAFPTAAREALGDTQLRRNLAHATRTIRDKRAAVVAEVEDWEELRVAGADARVSLKLTLRLFGLAGHDGRKYIRVVPTTHQKRPSAA